MTRSLVPVALALFMAGLLVWIGDLRAEARSAIPVLVAWGALIWWLPRPGGGSGWVLLAAIAVRLVLVASPASLSDDIYRYLWEGELVSQGGNPYLTAPASFGHAVDPIHAQVNHPEVSTIYPPLALWLFAAMARIWYAPVMFTLVMGIADALTAWGLAEVLKGRGRDLGPAWLYALHPLGAVESAGSGHLEALALLCVVLAIRAWDRRGSGLAWAGLGALIKLFPGVLLAVLWRRKPGLLLAVVALGLLTALPFLDAGPTLVRGLGAYARHWSFNGSLFPLLHAALGTWARPAGIALGAVVCLWAVLRRSDPAEVMLWAGGAFVLLSPTVHPWYVVWAWIPALLCGVRSWTLLATLMPLAYWALTTYDPVTRAWEEPTWPALVIYPPFLLALALEWWRHSSRPGPWAPGAATPR